MKSKTFTLAPGDFRWLLDRCERCWWQKIHSLQPPRDVLPAIFNAIDRGMKQSMTVEALRERGIPAKAEYEIGRLVSKPIDYPEHGVSFVLSGYLDKAFELEDGTFAITEFKAAKADVKKLVGYERQIHGYLTAVENPAKGKPLEISDLSIFCFEPNEQESFRLDGAKATFEGSLTHCPIDIDRAKFDRYLNALAQMASRDMPAPGEGCDRCAYVADAMRYQRDLERIREKQAVAS